MPNSIKKGRLDLSNVDVIINTTTTKFPAYLKEIACFHRVIVDESHEGLNTENFNLISSFRWAVTGTPCVKAFSDLERQLGFIGHADGEISQCIRVLGACQKGGEGQPHSWQRERDNRHFAQLVSSLQTLMIRRE